MDLVLVLGGLALLVAGGDILVRGAVALSLRLGIPAIIVSATVVAIGTSAPELIISIQAAIEGAPGIALGNVVGSNIANVWLVLGIPALIAPLAGCGDDARRSLYFMIAGTLLFTIFILSGSLPWWGGLALIAVMGIMVWDSVRHSIEHREQRQLRESVNAAANPNPPEDMADLEDVDPNMAPWKIGGLILLGVAMLPVGAQFLIDGARGVAMEMGVSEAAIGLTLVALGTSLPELATTVMAALRRQTDVAIGNVVGSNLFNITLIIGAAAAIAPLDVPREFIERDIWIMLAATAMLVPYVLLNRMLCRWTGGLFLLLYVGYAVVALS
ncbi:MAG: calcium/sodium antiporter [Pseudomonadota bacterium]